MCLCLRALRLGLTAANLTVPPRNGIEDAVKKVAAYRAPGRYFLLDVEKAEGGELLRAAEVGAVQVESSFYP